MSIEVKRNHGKPTAAERARAKLEAQKAAAQAAKTGVALPTAKAKAAKAPATPPAARTGMTGISGTANAASKVPGIPEIPVSSAPKNAKAAKTKPDDKYDANAPVESAAAAAPPQPIQAKAVPDKPRNYQIRFTGMKPSHVVEAALFAAGKPILVEEICEASGLRPEVVKDALKELVKDYSGRDTVLEIAKAGTKWAMQVRSKASEPAAKFAPMEIPLKTLKTLALIAYHQPMKQSELVDMLGSKVYDHVPELIERGLIRAREEGVTKILTTTALFPEYFGIDAESPEQIRMALAALVGMDPEKARVQAKPEAPAAAPQPPTGDDATPPSSEADAPSPQGDGAPSHEAPLQH